MRPRIGDCAIEQNPKTTLHWAVLDRGMGDYVDYIILVQDYTCELDQARNNLDWVGWE